jgi:hypothetical protein
MITLVRRLVIVMVLVLAGASLPAGPAHAMGSFSCSSGSRTYLGDLVGYHVIGSGCTGSGSGSGTITIPSGTYFCRSVTWTPQIGLVSGIGC